MVTVARMPIAPVGGVQWIETRYTAESGPANWDGPSGRDLASRVRISREPGVRQQLPKPVSRMARQVLKHILEIGEGVAPQPFRAGHEAGPDRRRPVLLDRHLQAPRYRSLRLPPGPPPSPAIPTRRSARGVSVGSTEASNGRPARVGRIDRSAQRSPCARRCRRTEARNAIVASEDKAWSSPAVEANRPLKAVLDAQTA